MWFARTATARGPTREGLRWAARIRTWTSWSRANRATVTPRPRVRPTMLAGWVRASPEPASSPDGWLRDRVEARAKRLQAIDLWEDGAAGQWTAREWLTYHLIARSAGPFV